MILLNKRWNMREKGREDLINTKEKRITNPKGLAQVVRALVLVLFLSGLRFKSPCVQSILWGQPAGEAGVLSDPCGA
jgi:hypothetical protein